MGGNDVAQHTYQMTKPCDRHLSHAPSGGVAVRLSDGSDASMDRCGDGYNPDAAPVAWGTRCAIEFIASYACRTSGAALFDFDFHTAAAGSGRYLMILSYWLCVPILASKLARIRPFDRHAAVAS